MLSPGQKSRKCRSEAETRAALEASATSADFRESFWYVRGLHRSGMFSVEKIFTKVTGTQGERDIKRLRPRIERINALEPVISAMSDDQMRARVAQFRKEIQEKLADLPPGIEREVRVQRRARIDEVLDPFAEETFALVREAAKRTLGQRHYDVQLIGGFVLHE